MFVMFSAHFAGYFSGASNDSLCSVVCSVLFVCVFAFLSLISPLFSSWTDDHPKLYSSNSTPFVSNISWIKAFDCIHQSLKFMWIVRHREKEIDVLRGFLSYSLTHTYIDTICNQTEEKGTTFTNVTDNASQHRLFNGQIMWIPFRVWHRISIYIIVAYIPIGAAFRTDNVSMVKQKWIKFIWIANETASQQQ